MTATEICADLYGSCACLLKGRTPCEAMEALADEGCTADDELDRIEEERQDAD